MKCRYAFTEMKYIKPNMKKAGSERWPTNWMGYMYLCGWYRKEGDLVSTPISSMGISLMQAGGGLNANAMTPRPQYGWNGKYPDTIGGEDAFLAGATKFLRTRFPGNRKITQKELVHTYTFSEPTIVEVEG